jgi:hypothetical protein
MLHRLWDTAITISGNVIFHLVKGRIADNVPDLHRKEGDAPAWSDVFQDRNDIAGPTVPSESLRHHFFWQPLSIVTSTLMHKVDQHG